MAVGLAGEPADRDRLAIWFGDIRVAVDGESATPPIGSRDIRLHEGRGDPITAEIGLGEGEANGLDLRPHKEYVAINGDYRS